MVKLKDHMTFRDTLSGYRVSVSLMFTFPILSLL